MASSGCCTSRRPATRRSPLRRMDLSPLLAPRSIAVVGATDRDDSYGGNVLRNLERAGFEGHVWGVNPKRGRCSGARASPRSPSCPSPSTRSWSRSPRPRSRGPSSPASSAAAGAPWCCRPASARSRRAAPTRPSCARSLARTTSPSAARTATGSSPSPRARRSGATASGRSSPGSVAMVTQSGNVGVNALGSRRGIRWHTVVSTGNQTVADASDWLAALAEPRRGALGGPLPRVRRRRREARRGAGAVRRARRRGRGAQGRLLGRRRARGRRPHRLARRRPARVPRPGRGGGRGLGRGLPRPAGARQGAGRAAGAPARRRRARGAHLLRRRLGGRRRPGVGDRARAAGPVARDRAATRGAAPRPRRRSATRSTTRR